MNELVEKKNCFFSEIGFRQTFLNFFLTLSEFIFHFFHKSMHPHRAETKTPQQIKIEYAELWQKYRDEHPTDTSEAWGEKMGVLSQSPIQTQSV